MAGTETPELLSKARQGIIGEEEAKYLQYEADVICQWTRTVAEDLLARGRPHRSIGMRIIGFIPPVTILGETIFKLGGVGFHVWEVEDQVRLQTSLNGAVPLVPVEMISEGGINPKRAVHIDIKVQGLTESLRLNGSFGVTYPGRNYSRYEAKRVKLPEEAQKWQELVKAIKPE